MRSFVPPSAALSVACLALSIVSRVQRRGAGAGQAGAAETVRSGPGRAAAGRRSSAVKQIALTEKQIEGVLAASKDMDAITDKIPDNAKPDPKVDAQLDAVAKKNGFASYDEYNNVVDNISMVLGGFDPATKKYVGAEAVLKAQIAQVQADKKMPAKDKKEALADLNEALKSPAPAIENKGNIDLVGQILRQARRGARRGRGITPNYRVQRKSPGEISGASFLSQIVRLRCGCASAS